MRFWFRGAAMAIVMACLAPPLAAHHSLRETHDISRTVTLAGVIARVDWANPHAHIYLDVKGANGAIATWSIEIGAPNTMIRYGLGPSALKPNDQISVDVWIARDSALSASAQSLKLSDGRTAHLAAPWADQQNR